MGSWLISLLQEVSFSPFEVLFCLGRALEVLQWGLKFRLEDIPEIEERLTSSKKIVSWVILFYKQFHWDLWKYYILVENLFWKYSHEVEGCSWKSYMRLKRVHWFQKGWIVVDSLLKEVHLDPGTYIPPEKNQRKWN